MLPKKYFDFIFILIMGFGMSLLMTLIITYINTGMDNEYINAIDKKDESTMSELLHDDFKFTMHKSGNTIGKADVIKWAMSGDINQDKARVVYENDEIGVHHSIVTFNDGNVEAVMAVYKYKDGKIISLETGATPMPK